MAVRTSNSVYFFFVASEAVLAASTLRRKVVKERTRPHIRQQRSVTSQGLLCRGHTVRPMRCCRRSRKKRSPMTCLVEPTLRTILTLPCFRSIGCPCDMPLSRNGQRNESRTNNLRKPRLDGAIVVSLERQTRTAGIVRASHLRHSGNQSSGNNSHGREVKRTFLTGGLGVAGPGPREAMFACNPFGQGGIPCLASLPRRLR